MVEVIGWKWMNELNRTLERFVMETGADAAEELRIIGRNMCVSLAHDTYPYGKGTAPKKQGQAAVERDIRKVFTTARGAEAYFGDTPNLKLWRRALAKKDEPSMRLALAHSDLTGATIAATPDRSLHKSMRQRGGRVHIRKPRQVVTQAASLNRYISEMKKRVGITKGGWSAAADDLGGSRGIPAWAQAKKHPQSRGRATKEGNRLAPTITIENQVPWARENLPVKREIKAMRIAAEKLQKRMLIILRKRSRRRGLRAA